MWFHLREDPLHPKVCLLQPALWSLNSHHWRAFPLAFSAVLSGVGGPSLAMESPNALWNRTPMHPVLALPPGVI